MFNFSFYELMVFGILALIILGPEKLPQAVRTVGTYYSKFRRTVTTLKAEMEAELDLAETRQLMQQELAKIRESEAQMQKEMAQLRGSIQEFEHQQNSQLQQSLAGTSDSKMEAEKEQSQQAQPNTEGNATDGYAYAASSDSAAESSNSTSSATPDQTEGFITPMTRPWENMWFLLGDYDRVRRLPPAPFLPNYTANPLLYNTAVGSDITTGANNSSEVKP